jgi:hypothetical protein
MSLSSELSPQTVGNIKRFSVYDHCLDAILESKYCKPNIWERFGTSFGVMGVVDGQGSEARASDETDRRSKGPGVEQGILRFHL